MPTATIYLGGSHSLVVRLRAV